MLGYLFSLAELSALFRQFGVRTHRRDMAPYGRLLPSADWSRFHPQLSEFGFTIRYRGHWGIGVRVCGDRLTISVPDSEESALRVVLRGRSVTVPPGETSTLVLSD